MHVERLKEAYAMAARSEDQSTQNGAVLYDPRGLLIGAGFNRIRPDCCATAEHWQKPAKYQWVTHAEQDAIFDAVRNGYYTQNATLYASWAACEVCAKTIIGCGVARVVRHVHPAQHRPDWAEALRVADEMMRAAGVELIDVREVLGVKVRFNGSLIEV